MDVNMTYIMIQKKKQFASTTEPQKPHTVLVHFTKAYIMYKVFHYNTKCSDIWKKKEKEMTCLD